MSLAIATDGATPRQWQIAGLARAIDFESMTGTQDQSVTDTQPRAGKVQIGPGELC